METVTFEIGSAYHVYDGVLDFTGTLTEIFDDGTGMVKSIGTGSVYRVELNTLRKL
jgi:hypothetical protein